MSWALRSLLSRSPHLLLFSRLRPVPRRVVHPTTVLGSNNLIGSRGYASNPSGDLHAEVKRHLYVVLDDYEDGYSIHKLDLEDDQEDLDGGGARRLPKPPFLRVTHAAVTERAQFAGVGSSIVAMGASLNVRLFFVYDIENAAFECTPRPAIGSWDEGHKAAVAVGGRLYMLDPAPKPVWSSYQRNAGGLVPRPAPHSVLFGSGWSSWEPLSDYSRWSCRQQCWNDQTPPFWTNHITAYAAAPHAPTQNEHEIFVSVSATLDRDGNRLGAGTFSFSTASLNWTRRGDWQMPVAHADYDGGLDAWLGLHAIHDSRDIDRPGVTVTDGRLCAGQITAAPGEWKVGGEKLFRLDEDVAAGWRHLDAKLVPMTPHDGGGEYCLMERLLPWKGGNEEECLGDDKNAFLGVWLPEEEERLLRLTAFHVERGHDGEPVATARHAARSYRLSRYNKYFDAQAFWM